MPRLSAIPDGCAFHPRCRHAFETCAARRPPLVAKEGRQVACHLYGDQGGDQGATRGATRGATPVEQGRERGARGRGARVGREFDVSRPWLTRVLAGEPRRTLRAVEDVTFAIERARTFGLVGESGSGKTTVARMVVGLLRPTAGSVRIGGVSFTDPGDAAARQSLRRRIHMVFQDPYASLNPRWRIGRIIAEPIRAFGLAHSGEAVAERVDELLDLVGLHPADRYRFPHEFSGGQRPAGSPSPAPSPRAPSSSSATSRPRPSTSPCRRRSST